MKYEINLIKKCIAQQCRNENDYYLSKVEKILYTAKAVIAITLNLGRNGKYSRYDENYVTVATLSSGKTKTEWGEGAEWEELLISKNWNEWRYVIDYDGYP